MSVLHLTKKKNLFPTSRQRYRLDVTALPSRKPTSTLENVYVDARNKKMWCTVAFMVSGVLDGSHPIPMLKIMYNLESFERFSRYKI